MEENEPTTNYNHESANKLSFWKRHTEHHKREKSLEKAYPNLSLPRK